MVPHQLGVARVGSLGLCDRDSKTQREEEMPCYVGAY